MKPIVIAVLVVVLAFGVAVSAQPAAQKLGAINWTAEQQDALDAFNKYIAAGLRGNINEMKTHWHPNFIGWNLKQGSPMNYDEFLKEEEEIFKAFRFKKLEFVPLAIQVEGNISIIHLKYDDVVIDLAGNEMPASGNWTTVMVKQDKKWLIMSNVWAEK